VLEAGSKPTILFDSHRIIQSTQVVKGNACFWRTMQTRSSKSPERNLSLVVAILRYTLRGKTEESDLHIIDNIKYAGLTPNFVITQTLSLCL